MFENSTWRLHFRSTALQKNCQPLGLNWKRHRAQNKGWLFKALTVDVQHFGYCSHIIWLIYVSRWNKHSIYTGPNWKIGSVAVITDSIWNKRCTHIGLDSVPVHPLFHFKYMYLGHCSKILNLWTYKIVWNFVHWHIFFVYLSLLIATVMKKNISDF